MKYLIMVNDLRLRGQVGRQGLMYVLYYGKYRAFISNYKLWREYEMQGKTPLVATSIISHESIHLTLNKFSFKASEMLDNLFGKSNKWERYSHGLGDLNELYSKFTIKKKNHKKCIQR